MATSQTRSPRAATSVASRVGLVAAAYLITRFLPGPGAAQRARDAQAEAEPRVPTRGGSTAGVGAKSPTEIPARGWWAVAKRVYEEVNNNRILAVAAGVTFYALLALFPAIAAFVSLYGLVADTSKIAEHLNALAGFLPGGAIDVIGGQIQRLTSNKTGALGFAFFTGLGMSLWSANAGVKAIFDALNIAYDEREKRGFLMLNLQSLAFTLGAIVFIMAAVSAVVVLPVVLKFLWLGAITEWLLWAGRWPAMLLLIAGAIALLYRFGPSHDKGAKWRWITPGSLVAAIGWIAFSMLFSWYIGSFGNYNETYGSLGAAIGFLTWVWLSTTIVLVGAELNAEIEHQAGRQTGEGEPPATGPDGSKLPVKAKPAAPQTA